MNGKILDEQNRKKMSSEVTWTTGKKVKVVFI